MANTRYLLDANVFISAARQYYPFDLVPAFWKCLEENARNGRVQSIDRVKEELIRGKDDLAEWAKAIFDGAFATTRHSCVLAVFGQIMTWAQSQNQFMDAAKAQFAECADAWLVAYAKACGFVVVTHEAYAPEARNSIKIPNVCKAFNVDYVDTWTMLRGLGAKLG
jgi:hypothetical protein